MAEPGSGETLKPPVLSSSRKCERCAQLVSSMLEGRHCRHCGNTFCLSCAKQTVAIPKFALFQPVRVCDECYNIIFRELRAASKTKLKESAPSRPPPIAIPTTSKLPHSFSEHARHGESQTT